MRPRDLSSYGGEIVDLDSATLDDVTGEVFLIVDLHDSGCALVTFTREELTARAIVIEPGDHRRPRRAQLH